MKAIILAAGVGSRLGNSLPKALTVLPNGKTILRNQIEILRKLGIKEIVVVVGFKKELIMEENPDVVFVYNPQFHRTNTAKSLQIAFELVNVDDVLWINGDVFFEERVIKEVIARKGNVIAVNKSVCGEEEVKYKTDGNRNVTEISKKVINGEGEAIGINKVCKGNFEEFVACLVDCRANDYFEKAIEYAIAKGVVFKIADISHLKCREIDFKKDLIQVEKMFESQS